MFKFTIGETYETQGGEVIRLVERKDKYPGYETVVDENGVHRYDRSTHSGDAGRVTGSPHDYSDLRNIKRENKED